MTKLKNFDLCYYLAIPEQLRLVFRFGRSGEIGRRARLKIGFSFEIVGSSPSCGTRTILPTSCSQTIMAITRFAPSPTGELHLGGVRTALFNWLWARKTGGQFILRIEDTDQQRLVLGAVERLMADLNWLGINWDWGPNRPHPDWGPTVQSQRRDSYQKIADQLIDQGLAYYDQTTPEELGQLRQQAQEEKRPFVFRQAMARHQAEAGKPTVVRVAIPDDLRISWTDQVKGDQSWCGADIGDFVILKSDGWPTYQLANVVDDQAMGVNQVMRGDEWLSSTPKHLYLFDQLGYQRPQYAHIPPVMAPTGNKKLSKRDGDSGNVDDYRQSGYPPEAIANFLALLGWNPGGEQEIFDLKELIEAFSLERLQTAGARFDQQRLDWISGHHIRRLNPDQRAKVAESWWPETASQFPNDYRLQVLDLVFERLKKWSQLADLTNFFFDDPKPWTGDEIAAETKLSADLIAEVTTVSRQLLAGKPIEGVETGLRELADKKNTKAGQLFMVVRIKLTGQTKTPNLLDIIRQLGPETCQRRLA